MTSNLLVEAIRNLGLPPDKILETTGISAHEAMKFLEEKTVRDLGVAEERLARILVAIETSWRGQTAESRGGRLLEGQQGKIQFLRHGDDFQALLLGPRKSEIEIRLSSLREHSDTLTAEVQILRDHEEIYFERLNLLSSRRASVIKILAERSPDLPWTWIIESVSRQTIASIRACDPTVRLEPKRLERGKHLVEPILLENEINVLYGSPGTCKSLLATCLALTVSGRFEIGGFRAQKARPVLILDGESSHEEWSDRLQLLGSPEGPGIHYRRLSRNLDSLLGTLRAEVSRLGAGLVIVDSFGPAAGVEPETADAAMRVLGSLRSLGSSVTTLLLCHVTKAGQNGSGTTSPYGSIYVQALARNIWEARREEDSGEDKVSCGLYHRKSNSTRLYPAIGLDIAFLKDQISVDRMNLADHEELRSKTPLRQQIRMVLLRNGALPIEAIAEELGDPTDSRKRLVKNMLLRMVESGQVLRLGEKKPYAWGVPEQSRNDNGIAEPDDQGRHNYPL